MELYCLKSRVTLGGDIFTKGKWYEIIRMYDNEVEVITNYDEWYKQIWKIYQGVDLAGIESIESLYKKKITIPFIDIRTEIPLSDSLDQMSLCVLSDKEVLNMGADISKDNNYSRGGRPAFCSLVYMVDDYFDYTFMRRDNKLNNLING